MVSKIAGMAEHEGWIEEKTKTNGDYLEWRYQSEMVNLVGSQVR